MTNRFFALLLSLSDTHNPSRLFHMMEALLTVMQRGAMTAKNRSRNETH